MSHKPVSYGLLIHGFYRTPPLLAESPFSVRLFQLKLHRQNSVTSESTPREQLLMILDSDFRMLDSKLLTANCWLSSED